MSNCVFLSSEQVQSLVGLSKASIWRLEQSGDFPMRRCISPGRVAWLREEIEAWANSRSRFGEFSERCPAHRFAKMPVSAVREIVEKLTKREHSVPEGTLYDQGYRKATRHAREDLEKLLARYEAK